MSDLAGPGGGGTWPFHWKYPACEFVSFADEDGHHDRRGPTYRALQAYRKSLAIADRIQSRRTTAKQD